MTEEILQYSKQYKIYRFCDGEIVDGLNRRHYNPKNEDDMQIICTIMNTHIRELNEMYKENKRLKETLNLIAEADSYTKENSVKEILRREIKAIDTVAGESADAWNDYCLLSNFFEEQYNELWDNYED